MALFAHACKHGQWLAPNPERLLPAALHAEWTLAEIAKAARLNEKTVLTCLTNLTECWVIVHDLKETMVSYYLLPAPRDLASIVVTALTLHSALDLPDLTEQVLRLGYKTHSQNLAQAIYNILSKLKKEGRVNRNHDKKTYSLIVTDL
jgi:DNA-binding IclR family transcriptional regulator